MVEVSYSQLWDWSHSEILVSKDMELGLDCRKKSTYRSYNFISILDLNNICCIQFKSFLRSAVYKAIGAVPMAKFTCTHEF